MVNIHQKKTNVSKQDQSWLKVNKLSLNISKTYYMIFNLVNDRCDENINIDNVDVDKVYCSKFLSVYTDCKLRWFEHKNSIRTKIARNLSVMHKC